VKKSIRGHQRQHPHVTATSLRHLQGGRVVCGRDDYKREGDPSAAEAHQNVVWSFALMPTAVGSKSTLIEVHGAARGDVDPRHRVPAGVDHVDVLATGDEAKTLGIR
jgi:hypothetical protein